MEAHHRESSDPYYDLFDDFDLIVSSFQSQYGLRLSREAATMKWDEFRDLLIGISPDTALGRIVAIRSEDDKNILKNFTKEQKRIRNKWMMRKEKNIKQEDLTEMLEQLQNAFTMMAGDLTE